MSCMSHGSETWPVKKDNVTISVHNIICISLVDSTLAACWCNNNNNAFYSAKILKIG